MFLNINIANGNYFRANHKYAFYKNSIQPQKIKQHNLHSEVIYSKHEKVKLFIFRYYETRKKIYLIWSKSKTQGTNNNFNNNALSAQKTKLLHCNQILTILTFIPDKHAKYQ